MDRIKRLDRYQKCILAAIILMALVFTVLYPMTTLRVGYKYQNRIFVPKQENGSTVYYGKLEGNKAQFTVSEDQTVTFEWGEKTYGPYIVTEDATAVPKGDNTLQMTGVEITKGEEILFRGGVYRFNESTVLYNEDGTLADFGMVYATYDGVVRDENGIIVDVIEPSATTILELVSGPTLTHKGKLLAWFGAMLICLANVVHILFADELFELRMSLRARNAYEIEPSELEIAGRYLGWCLMTLTAFALFAFGLL